MPILDSALRAIGVSGARRVLRHRNNPFLSFAPPGHFYSPLPDSREAARAQARLREVPRTIPGIDTRDDAQLTLLETFRAYYREHPFSGRGVRYRANDMFVLADALALYAVLRHWTPRHYIEVGSGWSSAVALDTNDRFLDRRLSCTFIEPYPGRLHALLTDEDRLRHRIVESPVQDVPADVFAALEPDDVLFIDSSHVAKIGSDVVYLLTDILPRLRPGVLVHIHDICWPFEYLEEWIREGRAWNEAYLVKAMLQHSSRYRILLFNRYLGTFHRESLTEFPDVLANPGGSLWLQVAERLG